mmetsp:Transcript_21224/g.31430  ORF Transcript_21224/g.31430 Transcript_21224/m.31430 type:complete len:87 (-) Transcript_21224:91-351(-)
MRLDNLSGSGGVYVSEVSAVVANRRKEEYVCGWNLNWHWFNGLIPAEGSTSELLLLLTKVFLVPAKYVEVYLRRCREDTSLDSCMY